MNKNAYFTLFQVNKNVNLVIFNMSKIAFCRFCDILCAVGTLLIFYVVCRFATLVVVGMLVGFGAMGYWLWAAIGIPYISLMQPLVILCLPFGEVPMRFRSGSDQVPMRFRWRWVANARQ